MLDQDYKVIEKFKNILNKHRLTPIGDQFETLSGRFYSFKVQNHLKLKFWVKIVKQKKPRIKAELVKEIQIIKLLDKNINKKTKLIHTLQYLDGEIKNSPQWFIYKYAKGAPINDVLLGYPKDFLNLDNLNKIIKTFKTIHALDCKKIILPNKQYAFYKQEFKKNTQNMPRSFFLSQNTIKNLEKFLIANKNIISSAPLALAHGDLFPQNILKDKNRHTIIDWGEAHLNNQAFDLATIYFNAWRNPAWQNKLLNSCIKNYGLDFKKLFITVLIRQTTMIMNIYGNIYDHPEKWQVRWPYNEKKYYKKIKPIIEQAWRAQQKNLQTLLKTVR